MSSAKESNKIYNELPSLAHMGITDYLTMRIDGELAIVIKTRYGVGVIFTQNESYTAEQIAFAPDLFQTLKCWKGKRITRMRLMELGFVAEFRYTE